jgi:hypothetical protein
LRKWHHGLGTDLNRSSWVHDIRGALTVAVLHEYLLIWDMMDGITLCQDVPDLYNWKLTHHEVYSSKSAYEAFFVGSIKFGPWKKIGKPGHLLDVSSLYGWCFITVFGLLIGLLGEAYPTRKPALFVIRRRKR